MFCLRSTASLTSFPATQRAPLPHFGVFVQQSQLSRILPVVSALQELLLLHTATLWSLKNMQAHYCSCATGSCTDKLDVCSLWKDWQRFTQTYITVWRDTHLRNVQTKINWMSQTDSMATGRRLYALHMDNKVTQFKSAWDKCTIRHTWNSLDVQEGKLWLGLVLFQTAEHLGSACSGQCPAESQAHHFPHCLDKEIQLMGPVPSQGFWWVDRPPTWKNWIRKRTWKRHLCLEGEQRAMQPVAYGRERLGKMLQKLAELPATYFRIFSQSGRSFWILNLSSSSFVTYRFYKHPP